MRFQSVLATFPLLARSSLRDRVNYLSYLNRVPSRLFSISSNSGENVNFKSYSTSYTLKFLPLMDVDNIERNVAYIDESPVGFDYSLPPIVIIGGTSQTVNTFLPHIHAIRRKYRLIIIELRGQGQTELDSNYCNMKQLVVDVESILNRLKVDKSHLAGFSFGGRVALAFAAHHPSLVQTLSLTGIPATRPPLGKLILQSWEDALSRGNLRECAWSFLINGYSEAFINQYSSKMQTFIDIIVAANNIERLRNLIRYSHVVSEDDPYSVSSCIKMVDCPIQLIAAKYDRIAGYEECLQLADLVPHTNIDQITMNTGHLAPFEDPVTWRNHLLRFFQPNDRRLVGRK